MKASIAFVLFLVAVASVNADNKYTVKYDGIDVQEILKSERLFKKYSDCVLDKAPCTADGQELKKNIPDALTNSCAKCSEKQKVAAKTIIEHVIKNKPDLWTQLQQKYDKNNVFMKKYDAELNKLKKN